MSVEVITKIRDLIQQGATVVGSPPDMSAGLKNYPESDEQVRKIAAEIWGDLDGKIRTEREFGKGRVIWGKTPREILLAGGVQPDFTFTGQNENPEQFDYIHRTSGDTEIYFVINRTNKVETRDFTFRVADKQPEIWNAVTGEMRDANAIHQAGGRTTVSLELDAFGSFFIVFSKPVEKAGKAERNFPKLVASKELDGSWKVAFDPQCGGPGEVEFAKLGNWINRPEEGIKYYSGKATYRKTFDLNRESNKKDDRLFLDLGKIKHVAEVRLNGKDLGIIWCAPWQVEITGAVKTTDNVLEVDVINLWANRVIGDLNLPKEKRFTSTHDGFRFDMLRGSTPLLDAGLMGPVIIQKIFYEK
jgi:hypothetical protein